MGEGTGLAMHHNPERTGSHLVGQRRLARVASVREEDAHILRHAGDQTVRHGVQTVEPHVVVMDVGIVVVSHQECVETGLAAVGVLHVDVVVDGVGITDGGQRPLGIHGVAVGVERVVGERGGIGHDDCGTAVDLIAEHHGIQGDRVVVGQFGLDEIGTHIVRERAVGVVEERGLHHDARIDELTVGETHGDVIHEPTGASLGTGRSGGGLVHTELETDVCRVGDVSILQNKLRQVEHLVVPPCVVRHSRHVVGIPVGIGVMGEFTSRNGGCTCTGGITVIKRAVSGEAQLLPLSPVVLTILIHPVGQLVTDGRIVQHMHLAYMVKVEIDVVDIDVGRCQRNSSRNAVTRTAGGIDRGAETLGRRLVQLIVRCPVRVRDSNTGHTPVTRGSTQ